MIKENRFKLILAGVAEQDMITYSALSLQLSVSEDTIRRDIDYLHQNGLLSKVKGGAMARNKNPLNFQDRLNHNVSEKGIIGKKTQQLLRSGMTVFMDGGSTVCAVAEVFHQDISLKIITNNLALVPLLTPFKNIELLILGGTYNRITGTNTGVKTCEDAKQYVADLYLMGGCAVSKGFGITSNEINDGTVKKAMVNGSKKIVLLVDSQKIGTNEFFSVCDLSKIDVIITELSSDDNRIDSLRFQDITIL